MFQNAYALLIGVDQSAIPRLALPVVVRDVAALANVLTHPGRCGYPNEHVNILTGTDATRHNILDGLDWLRERLEQDSAQEQSAIVYYSGHGHVDPTGETFLIPYDVRLPVTLNAIPGRAFAEAIDRIKPTRLLVVFDCCHAEGLGVKDVEGVGLNSAAVTPQAPGLDRLASGGGRAVLSSSRGSQLSYIRTDHAMSVFTYHFIEALTGHTGRSREPEVTVTEVMDYVGRKVPITARLQHGRDQEPMFSFAGTSFPLALVLGGEGIGKGEPAPDPLSTLPVVHATLTAGEVTGKVVVVDINEMTSGTVDASAHIDVVGRDGEATVVRIDKLGS